MRLNIEKMPSRLFVALTNFKAKLKGRPYRIRETGEDEIFEVTNGSKIAICRRSRFHFYKYGVDKRVEKLSSSYLLDRLPPGLEGAFIDCGANIGELGRFARSKGLDYHAFEPEPLEARCCDINNFGGETKTNRVALWHEDTTLKFYSKAETADSSAIEISDYDRAVEVPARSLDSYVAEKGISRIAVMKIEAEGAEPEVLAGAMKALAITDYVVVECGFERGVSQDSTLVPVLKIMTQAGFEMMDWHRRRISVLFKRSVDRNAE